MYGRASRKSAEIGLSRPSSALLRRARTAFGKSRKRRKKGLSPQIFLDLLEPPSLKPPFAAVQQNI